MRHRYSIGLAVTSLGIASLGWAGATSIVPPTPREVAQGVWLIAGAIIPNREPDGNTVIFDAPEGLIVVDTGRHEWHRRAILAVSPTRITAPWNFREGCRQIPHRWAVLARPEPRGGCTRPP